MEGMNLNPTVYQRKDIDELRREVGFSYDDYGDIDSIEVFDLVRDIEDPEHPLTLEELHVIDYEDIKVDDSLKQITVYFNPTVPNCSSASLIGLMILCKLKRTIHSSYYIRVLIKAGSHDQENDINKQLDDKERVAAAFENNTLMNTINAKLKDKYD